MKRYPVLITGLAILLLAACGQQQKSENTNVESRSTEQTEWFRYAITEDVAGDYAPVEEVRGAKWQLEHIFIAGPHGFEAWGASGNPAGNSPVMFVLSLEGQPLAIPATSFDLTEQSIRIEATSPETGAIRFEGQLDMEALETARRTLGSEAVVLKGTLRVGSQSFSNLGLKIKTGG